MGLQISGCDFMIAVGIGLSYKSFLPCVCFSQQFHRLFMKLTNRKTKQIKPIVFFQILDAMPFQCCPWKRKFSHWIHVLNQKSVHTKQLHLSWKWISLNTVASSIQTINSGQFGRPVLCFALNNVFADTWFSHLSALSSLPNKFSKCPLWWNKFVSTDQKMQRHKNRLKWKRSHYTQWGWSF